MLATVIENLKKMNATAELADADWLVLCEVLITLDPAQQNTLIHAASRTSGVPDALITHVFTALNTESLASTDQQTMLASLEQSQQLATAKIQKFQQSKALEPLNLESLFISRTEWLALINKFEHQKRQHLTPTFFLTSLSSIKKISVENLSAILSKSQSNRKAKQIHSESKFSSSKRSYQSYRTMRISIL